MKVFILYYSKTGHTLEAANAVAEGMAAAAAEAELVSITDFRPEMLDECAGLVVASPCWAGSLTANGVAQPLQRTLATLSPGSLKGKRCGAIAVYSWKGGATTVRQLGKLLVGKGCEDYRPGPVARAGVPFSVWKGPSVKPADEERFRAYGAVFVD